MHYYQCTLCKPIIKTKISKGIYINKIIDTPASQPIREPAAIKGNRNEWCYGLGLSLYDAGIPALLVHNFPKINISSRLEIELQVEIFY